MQRTISTCCRLPGSHTSTQSAPSGFPGGSMVKNLPAKTGVKRSIPGSGRSLGKRHGNPLQYPCLGNPGGLQSMGSQRTRHN